MRRYSAWLLFFVVSAVAFVVGCQQKTGGERAEKASQAISVAPSCTGGTAAMFVSSSTNGEAPAAYGAAVDVTVDLTGATTNAPNGSVTLTEPTTGLSCPVSMTGTPGVAGPGTAHGTVDLINDCGKLFPASSQGMKTYTVTASYTGDADEPCPTSNTVTIYIVRATTASTISFTSAAVDPLVYGQPLPVQLSIYSPSADKNASTLGAAPSGSVTLDDSVSQTLTTYSGTLSSSGASFSPPFGVGDHVLTSEYGGDENYDVLRESGSLSFTITTASSSVTNPSVSPNPANVNDTITFRATVSPVAPSEVMPQGTVYFYYYPSGSTRGAEDVEACETSSVDGTTGDASCTAVIPEGAWSTYATFVPFETQPFFGSESDDAVDLTVTSQAAFTLTLTSSADAATTYYGTPVTFTATINTTGAAPTGTVDFFRSDNPTNAFATVALTTNNGVTSATTPAVIWDGGSWTVSAVYYGDETHQNPPTCSDLADICTPTPGTDSHGIFISPHDTTTTFAVNVAVGSAESPVYGQTLTLKADLAPTASPSIDAKASAPTGAILFYDGACLATDQPQFKLAFTEVAFFPICQPLATVTLTNGSASFDIASLAIGGHDLRAVYSSGDGNYATSQGSQSITIGPASTNTVVSSSGTAVVNSSVTLSATITVVSPGAVGGTNPVTPSASELEEGSVVFKEGETSVGDGTLDPNQSTSTQRVYTFTTSSLTPGTHSLTATYSGGTHYATSTSAPFAQLVIQDGVSATVASSANPSTFGGDVTLTATLTSTIGGTPTGSITFSEDATTLGTATLTNGVGAIKLIAPAAGVHTITLSYGGDANHPASALKIFTQTVQAAPTTMTVSASANPLQAGQAVSVTAHLTAAQPVSGTVTFTEGGVSLGSAVIAGGDATLSLGSLAVGSHVITAQYAGNTSFGPSTAFVSVTVKPGTSSLALATSLTPSLAGSDVTFTATVTAVAPASGTPTGLVKFLRDGTPIGTVNLTAAGIASLTTNNLDVGANAITATYEGDSSFGPSEGALTQNVATNAAKIVVATAPNSTTFGQVVTITATLSGTAEIPTGTVTFTNGTTTLHTVVVGADGTASFATGILPVGMQTLTAVYSGSATYAAGSASVVHSVVKAATQVAVTASANPANVGDAITFDATVTANGVVVEGDVEVLNGATSLGTATLVAGHATYTTNQIPAGTHTITVNYKGNDRFEAASTTLTVTVNQAASGSSGSSSSSGSAPPSSAPPSGTPNTSGGLNITPGGGGENGGDCAVSNVGSGPSTGLGGGLVFAIALAAAMRRRQRAA
jgi:hypothetical protein